LMVRITLYDPKISAEVYSQRREAEQGFDSGVATGLARLGRALTGRGRGFRAAGSEAVALEAALGFWEDEVGRLDELGARIPRGKPGFHDLAMKQHLARRDEAIAGLKQQDPAAAERFDLRTLPLTEALERRAGAIEAGASGDGLAGGLEAALKTAARAVRADPLQHDAIRDGVLGSLAEMEANGVDAGGLAEFRVAVDRNLAGAAIVGLIADEQFDAARELLTEGRLPALAEEDRKQLGRRLQRAEARAAADGNAETAGGIDAYRAGFEGLQEILRQGGEAPDLDYADEMIRRVLPEDQAEEMIAAREAAEDRGAAYRPILLADRANIEALIAEAGPGQEQFLRKLAEDRDRALRDHPAAFMLAHPWVRRGYDRLLQAIEGGDADTIAAAGRAYARGTVNEQRRLGVPEPEWQVLPPDLAAETVAAFRGAGSSDLVALGAELQARYGELAPIVLRDLVRAGLPHGEAIIAAMRRPEQREAARALSALAGIPTSELRNRIAASDQATVDKALEAVGPDLPGRGPSDPEGTAKANLIERRIYDLIERGEAVETAVVTAVSDVMGEATATAAARRWADEIEASRVDPEKSMLVPLFREYAEIDTEDRRGLQPVLFSRIPFSLLGLASDAPENVAWLERALLGEDPDQKEFAAAYLEHTGSVLYQEAVGYAGDVPLQEVLSPEALESYLRYWHEPFSPRFRRQRYSEYFNPEKTVQLAEIYAGEMPLPHDMAHGIADAIQQSLYRSDRDAEALLEHLDRVVAPLDRAFAERLKSTVEALNASRDNLETLHGRYAYYLSDEELLDVGKALGLLKRDFTQTLDVPDDLAEHLGVLTPFGAGVAVGGAADAVAVGLLANPVGATLAAAGLAVAGIDIYNAINDHDTAHSHYFFRQEVQRRLHDRSGNTDPEAEFNVEFEILFNARKENVKPGSLPPVNADFVAP